MVKRVQKCHDGVRNVRSAMVGTDLGELVQGCLDLLDFLQDRGIRALLLLHLALEFLKLTFKFAQSLFIRPTIVFALCHKFCGRYRGRGNVLIHAPMVGFDWVVCFHHKQAVGVMAPPWFPCGND